MTTIPKIIHQTWKTEKIPSCYAKFVQSWKTFHPDWEYILWTDEDNRQFISEYYPWFLPVYDKYPKNIQRADAIRYFILHHFGGLYVDLDFECRQNFDGLFQRHTFIVGQEPIVHANQVYKRKQIICNALIASVPEHPVWTNVFKELIKHQHEKNVLWSTGPGLFDDALRPYIEAYHLYIGRPDMFYPKVAKRYPQHSVQEKDVWAVHYWANSWVCSDI